MDFVADNLFNGRRIRALTVVNNFSRECLAIEVARDCGEMMLLPLWSA
jgi:putative transposase